MLIYFQLLVQKFWKKLSQFWYAPKNFQISYSVFASQVKRSWRFENTYSFIFNKSFINLWRWKKYGPSKRLDSSTHEKESDNLSDKN
jgi:hypothetical protein